MMRRMGSAGLGFGQLFVLVFGFLVASVLIFLFGIWVGRDITERRLAQEERVVRLPVPVQPTAKEEEKSQDVDVAFYQSLKEKAYQHLQETAAPATPAHVARASTPTAPPPRVAEKPKPPPTPGATAKVKRAEPPRAGDEWADAGWTVQVNATTNPQQATELARNLRAKGYDAYTVQAPMHGQTWYRVRVGRFGNRDRDKAKELEARLKNDGLENAYVTPQ
jgi:cell division septation protein DedD